jgi:hypothetical protein
MRFRCCLADALDPEGRGAMMLTSEIACPECGHRQRETMAVDACQYYYECVGCGALLKPRPGDCCVFCSFGSVPCPTKQAGGVCPTQG